MDTILVSIHMPKTGGLTFREYLIKLTNRRCFKDYSGLPPNILPPVWTAKAIFDSCQKQLNYFQHDFQRIRQIRRASRRQLGTPIAVHGHFYARKYDKVFPQAKRLIWLRDPAQRLVSQYYYWLRSPVVYENPIRRKVIEDKLTFSDFVPL